MEKILSVLKQLSGQAGFVTSIPKPIKVTLTFFGAFVGILVVFEQREVEMPSFWSQQATNIVVSKYFRGQMGSPDRERSVKQLIGRVVDTITRWARDQHYFASEDALGSFSAELKHLLVYQKAAFNSPVWFNCGFEAAPQCSACFINSVKDTMDSILTLARTEGMLFKFGSGTGSNLSTIRSSRELLAAARRAVLFRS